MKEERHYTGECVADAISSSNVVISSSRTAAVEYEHDLVQVDPDSGYFKFTCSSNLQAVMTAYQDVKRCPMCRANKPFKG
jgi:hypothetical protein